MWWDNCQCAVCMQKRRLYESAYQADESVLAELIKKALETTSKLREQERAGEPPALRFDE